MDFSDFASSNPLQKIGRTLLRILAFSLGTSLALTATSSGPEPLGKLVDLGGHWLHVNCSGRGGPTVIVENGLGDFSFDWILVQSRVSSFTRICTYDRAGYAWSDPGPKPRTFSQINFELRDALFKLGEKGPFVLVGHSYGGPLVRNFAATYPQDVAGMVQVDAAFEGMHVGIGGKKDHPPWCRRHGQNHPYASRRPKCLGPADAPSAGLASGTQGPRPLL